jgi:hypothetical protein
LSSFSVDELRTDTCHTTIARNTSHNMSASWPYIHTCIQTYIHTYMHAYIHTCMHTYIHRHTHMHACMTYTHMRRDYQSQQPPQQTDAGASISLTGHAHSRVFTRRKLHASTDQSINSWKGLLLTRLYPVRTCFFADDGSCAKPAPGPPSSVSTSPAASLVSAVGCTASLTNRTNVR